MLRITHTSEDGQERLALEGKLVGAWVEECRSACARGGALALDLSEVRYADAQGVAFLREMAAAGRIQKTSRFVAELLRSEGREAR